MEGFRVFNESVEIGDIYEGMPENEIVQEWIQLNEQFFIDKFGKEEGSTILKSIAWMLAEDLEDDEETPEIL